jgi:hypothetical protein
MKKDIIFHNNTAIIPDPSLSGETKAYQINRGIYVSPAIFELLQDDEVKADILRQVKVVDLTKEREEIIKKMIERQNEKTN